jgi:hypothetical protein
MISSLASKWQVLKVRMLIFQPFYDIELKNFKFQSLGILKPVKILRPNLNQKLFISEESNIEMQMGVATLPDSRPLEHRHFTSIKRVPVPTILSLCV